MLSVDGFSRVMMTNVMMVLIMMTLSEIERKVTVVIFVSVHIHKSYFGNTSIR